MPLLRSGFFRRVVVSLALVSTGLWYVSQSPSDAALMAGFQVHRSQLEQLKDMVLSDGRDMTLDVLGITWNVETMPEARREVYRRLLWQVGACCVGGSPATQTMGVTVLPLIPWPGVPVRTYLYATQPPTGLTAGDTLAYVFQPGQARTICRPLEDDWYLCLDYED
jgi:hypothetical protein